MGAKKIQINLFKEETLGAFKYWCPEQDSNLHIRMDTSP